MSFTPLENGKDVEFNIADDYEFSHEMMMYLGMMIGGQLNTGGTVMPNVSVDRYYPADARLETVDMDIVQLTLADGQFTHAILAYFDGDVTYYVGVVKDADEVFTVQDRVIAESATDEPAFTELAPHARTALFFD